MKYALITIALLSAGPIFTGLLGGGLFTGIVVGLACSAVAIFVLGKGE